MNKELLSLIENRERDLPDWLVGKIPHHYKSMSIDKDKSLELAKLGATKIAAYFGAKLYFSQAVMAGAILSGEYDENTITTCSQYGKSWLMGMVALLLAYEGNPVYVAASSGVGADIIMANVVRAVLNATPEIQNELLTKKDQLERLQASLSKTKVAFTNGGFVEAITLADTYSDNDQRNMAVGRAGIYIIDEADLVSEDTLIETGRREFARVDGEKFPIIMISNPRNRGYFYSKLTEENPDERHFILWMDALTAIEEERWTQELVLNSDFAQNKRTCKTYLLCELDQEGESMFETPIVYEAPYKGEYAQYFLGVDAAYSGKDNICLALNAFDEDGIHHIEEVHVVDKGEWIEGVTPEQIISDVARIARRYRCGLTCVDIGWGAWLTNGLMRKGIPCKGVPFGAGTTPGRKKARHYASLFGANMRAEMHLDLQDLIERGGIEFSEQAYFAVKDTLPYVNTIRKPNGKIDIIPKKEIKERIGRSPDELDSVLLAIHAPIVFGGEWASFN